MAVCGLENTLAMDVFTVSDWSCAVNDNKKLSLLNIFKKGLYRYAYLYCRIHIIYIYFLAGSGSLIKFTTSIIPFPHHHLH